ncbi:MAG: hypothetical protein ABIV06_13060, partial [Thermoanaerobaculia bacterium]
MTPQTERAAGRTRGILSRAAGGLFAAGLLASSPLWTQEIFSDPFESGTLCSWSFPPAGFEVGGNGLDDDCDGAFDEAPIACDVGLPSNSADPLQFAAAMNLCGTTTENGHDWGVISGTLSLASGTGTSAAASKSIRSTFGASSAQNGNAMVVLSSGAAAAPDQANPAHAVFQNGLDTGTQSAVPADWLAAHGGILPVAPGCPQPSFSGTAYNPVMLTYRIRVPGNAHSFRLGFRFFTAEFPEYVCTSNIDYFVALLESGFSGAPANPVDENLATYVAPGGTYPVGAHLANDDTGLFEQCQNGPTGCNGGGVATISSCTTTSALNGSGMEVVPTGSPPPLPWCDAAARFTGGGTNWLWLRGNVAPGENLTLRLAIWDGADGLWDSVVLLDDFQWSTEP